MARRFPAKVERCRLCGVWFHEYFLEQGICARCRRT